MRRNTRTEPVSNPPPTTLQNIQGAFQFSSPFARCMLKMEPAAVIGRNKAINKFNR